MPTIKSISGIRGTIGNNEGDLKDQDIIDFVLSYAFILFSKNKVNTIIIGRDARESGEHIKDLVINTLIKIGVKVIDLDLATTPTVEIAVTHYQAQGGIIITASHNPQEWNALKFLNYLGEFLSLSEAQELITSAGEISLDNFNNSLGRVVQDKTLLAYHIKKVLDLDLVKPDLIANKKFKVVVDGINSVGGLAVPALLKALGVEDIIKLNCFPDGQFAHLPEPLDKNLSAIKDLVLSSGADLGIVVDPDVDRLAFIDEQGQMFGEEYTLVAVAEYVLKNYHSDFYHKSSVSNLSSSRALRDISKRQGASYYASAVGEVNVVEKIKEALAVIGGEGNGGIIYPEFHYGRDALVGIALFLSSLVISKKTMSEFKKEFPEYFMVKDKIKLSPKFNLAKLLAGLKKDYSAEKTTDIDGLKIDWKDSWLHLRASNTEPIIRIYAEALNLDLAQAKVREIKEKIKAYIR